MANRRMVASDIWRDDFVCGLDYFQRLLWIGMVVTCADDQGRIQDRAGFIASDVFPGEMLSFETIENALNQFESEGKIIRYVADKVKLIQIVNWWNYQTPSWASPSKYQPPTGWTDRVKVHTKDNKVYQLNWELPGGMPTSQLPVPTPVPTDSQPPVRIGIEDGDVNGEGKSIGEDGKSVAGATEKPSPSAADAWCRALGDLQSHVTSVTYETYLAQLKLVQVHNSRDKPIFIVKALTTPTADLVRSKYGQTLNYAIQGYYGKPTELQIIV